jgi:hypothetical protein
MIDDVLKILSKMFPEGIPVWIVVVLLALLIMRVGHDQYLKHQLSTAERKLIKEQRKSIEIENHKKQQEGSKSLIIVND